MTRTFAIVPAAGCSLRMGTSKLLLPWRDATIIECTLAAWKASRADHVLVVVRTEDRRLGDLCRSSGVDVVKAATAPPDMKASITLALRRIARDFVPDAGDAWLAAPADLPEISSRVIDDLIRVHDSASPQILFPVHQGRRGHPALFPWSLAKTVSHLPTNTGVRDLLLEHAWREIPCGAEAICSDVDTPEDYRRQVEPNVS